MRVAIVTGASSGIGSSAARGRFGEPTDIGKAIAAFLSDDLAWTTAQNLDISGGFNL